jgi:hypothetical protein
MPLLTARTLLASAAQVAGGTGAAVDLGADTSLDLNLGITAISGTLSVELQTSPESTYGWRSVVMQAGDEGAPVGFTAATTTGIQSVSFAGLDKFVRVSWTLTGAATFSVLGSSVRVYAKPADLLALGLHPKVLAPISTRRMDIALREQTDRTDSAISRNFETPLAAWGFDVRAGVSACAACALMTVNGLRPGQDDLVAKRCKMFDDWLDMVACGKRRPAGAIDATPDIEDGGGYLVTEVKRGW